jgi:hypothetical protein
MPVLAPVMSRTDTPGFYQGARVAAVRALLLALVALALTAPAAGAFELHAHRGGALTNGKPAALENALSTFKSAPARGADVAELWFALQALELTT